MYGTLKLKLSFFSLIIGWMNHESTCRKTNKPKIDGSNRWYCLKKNNVCYFYFRAVFQNHIYIWYVRKELTLIICWKFHSLPICLCSALKLTATVVITLLEKGVGTSGTFLVWLHINGPCFVFLFCQAWVTWDFQSLPTGMLNSQALMPRGFISL